MSNRRATWPLAAIVALPLVPCLGVAAHAQDAEPAGDPVAPVVADEIVVTATKKNREPVNTPGEVTIVDLGSQDHVADTDLAEALRYVPALEFSDAPRSLGLRPNIRGLGTSRVLVTTDGARSGFQSGHKGQLFVEPAFLRRAEVVRGPSSALFGSGALGGALLLETIDTDDIVGPDSRFGFRQRLSHRNNADLFGRSSVVGGRFDPSDDVTLGFVLGWAGRDSNDVELSTDDDLPFSEVDQGNTLAKFEVRVTDEWRFELGVLGFDDDTRAPANLDQNTTDPTLLTDRTTEQDTVTLSAQWTPRDEDWVDLRFTVYETDLDILERRLDTGARNTIEYETEGFDVHNVSNVNVGEFDTILTVGLEYFGEEQGSNIALGNTNGAFPSADSEHWAPYAQAEMEVVEDKVFVVPGVRFDDYELKSPGLPKSSEDELSTKLGVVYHLGEELDLDEGDYFALTANYSEGFRAPTFQELFIDGPHFAASPFFPFDGFFIANPTLMPETSETFEWGARAKFGDLRVHGAVHRTDAEDFITSDVTTSPPAGPPPAAGRFELTNINSQDAELWGYELESEYVHSEFVRFWANLAHTRGEDSDTNEDLNLPPRAAAAGVEFGGPDRGWTFGVRGRYASSQNRIPTGGTGSDRFKLLDVAWTVDPAAFGMDSLDGFTFTLGANNLASEEYTPFLNGQPGPDRDVYFAISFATEW